MATIVSGEAAYTIAGVAKTGLTVTVDVIQVPKGNLAGRSLVATGAAAVELLDGLYGYEYAAADTALNRYLAVFKTADVTVDQQDIACWMVAAAEFAEPGALMGLANDAITAAKVAADAGAEIADAVLDEVVEGAYTLRHLLRLFASALLGEASGGGTTTVTFRDLGDTKVRITMTVTAVGNRTATVLDPT